MPSPYLRVNWKYAGGMAAVVVVAAGAFYGIRHFQLQNSGRKMLSEAVVLQEEGRHKEALPILERYVALLPHDPEGCAAYAQTLDKLLTGTKGRGRAYMAYAEALRNGVDDETFRRRAVEIALEVGRTNEALSDLESLERDHRDDAWIHFHKGRCRELTAAWRPAAEEYEKTLAIDSGHAEAAERLARILTTRLEEPARALQVLNGLVEKRPRRVESWLARARHHQNRKDWKSAAADLEQAATLAPGDAAVVLLSAQNALARTIDERPNLTPEQLQSMIAPSRAALHGAVENAPRNPDLWLTAAEIETRFGTPDAATDHLQRGLKAIPGDVRLQSRLAERHILDGRTGDARALIERMTDASSSRPLAAFLDGRVKMAETKWEAARDALEVVLRDAVAVPELADHAAIHLAECYRQLGNTSQEVATYRRVLRNDPRSEPARLGIADAAMRSGQSDDAILEYRQLAYLPQVRPILARLLIDRNERLPEPARDWIEVDKLLSRMEGDASMATLATALATRAKALRANEIPAAKPRLAAAPASRTNNDTIAPGMLREITAEVEQNRLPQAAALWSKARRRVSAAAQPDLHAGYADALLRRGHTDVAKDPLDLLRRAEPHTLRTVALSSFWHVERGECLEAHRILESFASQTTGDEDTREDRAIAAACLASHLADRAESATKSKSADCDKLRHCSIELSRRVIQKHPERLLLLAGFHGAWDDRSHPLDLQGESWQSFLDRLADDPALIVSCCERLRPSIIARLESAAAEAVRRDLSSGSLRIGLGDFEGLLGRFDVAEKWYRSVLDVEPTHHLAMNNLAWLLALQRQQPQEALRLVEKAIQTWGSEPRLLDTRGCVYIAMKQPEKALADLEASLRARPGPVTALHLAEARFLAKDRPGAAAALRIMRDDGVTAAKLHPLERIAFNRLQKELAAELLAESAR